MKATLEKLPRPEYISSKVPVLRLLMAIAITPGLTSLALPTSSNATINYVPVESLSTSPRSSVTTVTSLDTSPRIALHPEAQKIIIIRLAPQILRASPIITQTRTHRPPQIIIITIIINVLYTRRAQLLYIVSTIQIIIILSDALDIQRTKLLYIARVIRTSMTVTTIMI
jgi:hypothetical protein